MKRYVTTIAILVLCGCTEKELPINPVPPGELEINSPSIGSDYGTQVYYSLSSNEVVASNQKTDWCFALQLENNSAILSLNSSRYMKISLLLGLNNTDFVDETTLEEQQWHITPPQGADQEEPPLTLQTNSLYILDLGRSVAGESLGYARFYVPEVSDWEAPFEIQIGPLNLSESEFINVDLDPSGSRLHFSALTFEQKEIEPDEGTWELWLTQYTEILDEETQYLVTGILTPSPQVQVYQSTFAMWDSLLLSDWSNIPFNSEWNEIGYDWKFYDLSQGSYSIDQNIVYCIKTQKGREYLMRILDFYDNSGQTGLFTFESIER